MTNETLETETLETETPKRRGRPPKAEAAKFVFIGDGRDLGERKGVPLVSNPESIVFLGIEFELNGDPVAVSDEKIAEKLAANSHFKQVT